MFEPCRGDRMEHTFSDGLNLEDPAKKMSKAINILDRDYIKWVKSLVQRYRQSQIKSAVKVNTEQLRFYWLLGRDIIELDVEKGGERKLLRGLALT